MSQVRTYTFRDAGLKPLPLRALNLVGEGLRRSVGYRGPGLLPDALESEARKKTSLQDFGPSGYREGLEVLCRSMEDEANLSLFGRMAMRGMIVQTLSNRLLLLDWAKRHPEVRDEPIRRPWVILGLPRTGTTLLSLLLGLDPNSRPLLQWEASTPVPPPELATQAEDPRIAAAAKQFNGLMGMNPAMRAMHPMGATLATECVTLLFFDLRSLSVETQALLPTYGKWLEDTDMRDAYAMHRLALQVLQSRVPTETWSLKTPQHLWSLNTLVESYPDARLIWTHRDPAKVVASVASLNTTLQAPFTRQSDPIGVGRDWTRKLRLAVDRGMAHDERATGASWCHHLNYSDLMKDPVGSVQRLYQQFGDEVSPLHTRRMEAWMRDRPQETFGRHGYDATDFGLTTEGIREEFATYCERYDIPEEG